MSERIRKMSMDFHEMAERIAELERERDQWKGLAEMFHADLRNHGMSNARTRWMDKFIAKERKARRD